MLKSFRPIYMLLTGLILPPGMAAAASGSETSSVFLFSGIPVTQPLAKQYDGPWGILSVQEKILEPPAGLVSLDRWERPETIWFFRHHTMDSIEALFTKCGMLDETIQAFMGRTENNPDGGVITRPPDKYLLRLPSMVRTRLYRELSRSEDNVHYRHPLSIPSDDIEYWLDRRDLDAETAGCLNDLLYPHNAFWMLSDVDCLLRCITDSAQKQHILDVVMRQTSAELSVEVAKDSDVDQIASYWQFPRDQTNENRRIRHRIEQARESGEPIPLLDLLPGMPAQVLNRYAVYDENVFRDCHWTAMNFFNETPRDAFRNAEYIRISLTSDYVAVKSAPAFGDVIVLRNSHKDVVHSCNYIAGNKVFTKNGGADDRPWTLMPLEEVVALYSLHEPVEAYVFRRKDIESAGSEP